MIREVSFQDALAQIMQGLRPEVAQTLRACAIPHWFDQDMIVALRAAPEYSDKIIRRLLQFTFVDKVGPGRFSLHDNVRDYLLEELRRERGIFLEYHSRALADITRRLNIQIDESLEWERIFHQLAVDEKLGLSRLEQAFDMAEQNRRFSVCELLIARLRENQLYTWADYYGCRLAILLFQPETAESMLLSLLHIEDLPVDLRARVKFALGSVALQKKDWNAAIAQYESALHDFVSLEDSEQVGSTQLAIANTYADFAINLKLDSALQVKPQLRHSVVEKFLPLRWRAGWFFKIKYLGSSFIYLPLTIYFFIKSSGTTFWHLPRFRWTFSGESPLEQVPVMRLVGRALQWYTAAGSHQSQALRMLDVRIGLARLLYHFTNPWASSEILQSLVDNFPDQVVSEYRLAQLQKDLARSYLASGQNDLAQTLLCKCLDVARRYSDVTTEANILALLGHTFVFSGPIETAIGFYRESIIRYTQIKDSLSIGWLMYDIERLKDRRRMKYRSQLLAFFQNPELDNLEQVYFSRPSRRFLWKYFWVYMIVAMGAIVLCLFLIALFSSQYFLAPLLILLSFGVGTWTGFTAMAAMMWRDFPPSELQKQQPCYLRISGESLTWLKADGSLDRQIPWSHFSGAISRRMSWWRDVVRSHSWLRLYTADKKAEQISGYTADFDRVVTEIKRMLSPTVRWIDQNVVYVTTVRSIWGCWAPFLFFTLPMFLCAFLAITSRSGEYIFLLLLATLTTAFSLLGMPYLAIAAELRSKLPVTYMVFVAGGIMVILILILILLFHLNPIFGAVFLANGFYWLIWAIRRLRHPTYLVP